MIFISHANEPQDNEFTRWLALRLAGLGYPIWCDQTKLLGGEQAWNDIEKALRERTQKFLVVLSRNSNERENVLKEVTVAEKVGKSRKDFIIPLRIDDLHPDQTTIELARINSIDFAAGWSSALLRLLKKLEEDGVQRDDARFNHGAVARWWRDNELQITDVSDTPEVCASNWFRVGDLPERIYVYSLVDPLVDTGSRVLDIDIPNYRERGGLLSLEEPEPMKECLSKKGLSVAESNSIDLGQFQAAGHSGLKLSKQDARNIVTSLVKQAFALRCLAAGLKAYELSSGNCCYWFVPDLNQGDKVYFDPISTRPRRGKPNRRMVGKALDRNGIPKRRRWHFGISAKLIRWPDLALSIQTHVVFTDPAKELLAKAKQHKARRSECRSWHNDTWLNRMLAAIAFLRDPESSHYVTVPCGERIHFTVSTRPLCFRSPISFGIHDPEDAANFPDDDNDDLMATEDEINDEEDDDTDADDSSL